MVWQRQHVLGLADFTPEEYQMVLQTSASFQEVLTRRLPKVPTLQGKVVVTLFFEPSTRTRSSFELAAKRLSADVLNFSPGTSSLGKGETLLDTARTFLAMGSDLLIVRHAQAGVPQQLAAEIDRRGSPVGVLNAGDGLHEHPTQGLLDLFTLCSHLDPRRPRLELLQGNPSSRPRKPHLPPQPATSSTLVEFRLHPGHRTALGLTVMASSSAKIRWIAASGIGM